jgi:phage terminase small subunit
MVEIARHRRLHKTGIILTPKHRRFVAEYLIDLDATHAAIRAGYSKRSASSLGYQLLQKPSVRKAVMEGKAKQLDRAALTADRVLQELARVAFVNGRDYWTPDGDAKHPNELTVDEGACLAGFEVLIKNAKAGDGVTDTVHKFKLWDKVHALEILAKHFKLLVDRVEVVNVGDRVARLVAARKRVDKK